MKKATPKVQRLRTTERLALQEVANKTVTRMHAFRFSEEDYARWRAAAASYGEGMTMTKFIQVACNLLSQRWG